MPALKNARHERFALDVANGVPATTAYAAAGFRPNAQNAHRLTKHDDVQTRIDEILSEREHIHAKAIELAIEKTGISIGRVLEELAKLGFSNIADYVDVTGEAPRIHLSDVPPDKLAALSEITTETVFERTNATGAPTEVRRVKLKLWDKKGALVDIGRHLGMFTDKMDHRHIGDENNPVAIKDMSAREFVAGRIAGISVRLRSGEDNSGDE